MMTAQKNPWTPLKIWSLLALAVFSFSCSEEESQLQKLTKKVEKEIAQGDYRARTQAKISRTLEGFQKELEGKSQAQFWDMYKQFRAKAKSFEKDKNYQEAIALFAKAATVAQALSKPDIASWQFNSAGKNAIDAFRKQTDYEASMKYLKNLPSVEERKAFRNKLREGLKSQNENLFIAKKYLEMAKQENQKALDEARTKVISSNLEFIEFVEEFTNGKD